ncbi:MAG: hypothetical protein JOZ49_05060 [Mycolicibacterium sp.]|nr:hypothetical protein [Mycolicibacterium sp.]
MPAWGWFFVAAAIFVIIALAIMVSRMVIARRRTHRLKERFGPEYERTVGQLGEQHAAEKELGARERKRAKLDIVPLAPEARERYADTWQTVQTAFVDDPSNAVEEADRLLTQVMRARGYPIDDFDQQAADISVDHPTVVENYRAAHSIHLRQEQDDVGTEDQRKAFVHYRALFEKLLEPDQKLGQDDKQLGTDTKEARA